MKDEVIQSTRPYILFPRKPRIIIPSNETIALLGTVVLACAFATVSDAATIKGNRHRSKIHVCATCTGSDPCKRAKIATTATTVRNKVERAASANDKCVRYW